MKSFSKLVGCSLMVMGLASGTDAHAQFSPSSVMLMYTVMDNGSSTKPTVPKVAPGTLSVQQQPGMEPLRVQSIDTQGMHDVASGQGVDVLVPPHAETRTVRVLYEPRAIKAKTGSQALATGSPPSTAKEPPLSFAVKEDSATSGYFINSERLQGFQVRPVKEGAVDLVFPPSASAQRAIVVMSMQPDQSLSMSVSAGLNTWRAERNMAILFGSLIGLGTLLIANTRSKNESQSPLQRLGSSVAQGVRRRRQKIAG